MCYNCYMGFSSNGSPSLYMCFNAKKIALTLEDLGLTSKIRPKFRVFWTSPYFFMVKNHGFPPHLGIHIHSLPSSRAPPRVPGMRSFPDSPLSPCHPPSRPSSRWRWAPSKEEEGTEWSRETAIAQMCRTKYMYIYIITYIIIYILIILYIIFTYV